MSGFVDRMTICYQGDDWCIICYFSATAGFLFFQLSNNS